MLFFGEGEIPPRIVSTHPSRIEKWGKMGAAYPKFQKILQTKSLKQLEKNCDN
jgi:hypothetical protein